MEQNKRSNESDDVLRARAIDLREQGWSNPEIRAELGLSGWKLTQLFQGHVDPRHENLANRAKTEVRAKALDLREQGWSYDAIARRLRVSKSSLSLWLRDLPKPDKPYPGPVPKERKMTQEEWEAHCANRVKAKADAYLQGKVEERKGEIIAGASEIGEVTDRELLIAGAMIYWCEGAKSKPWRRQNVVVLINSDPDLIRLFLRFLGLCGWGCDRLSFRLSIHESADVDAATRFWAEVVGVPEDRFKSPSLKKHNPETVRKKVGDHYQGCLVVYAQKSAGLYRRIEGLSRAVMLGSTEAIARIRDEVEPPGR
ncbi:helix-turn-helix domain-containing protein [Actinorugispora endophytica]|uniref:Homeodomain-like domain-containing protein n=1 Tax=Actinorugispora endophytica TaxID=1605990 RepID=A0A4R6V6Y9_9ACTN|nr:helix-turn-helix domain-containing protein [Actinorugispora endophytica]TDQ54866.1 Homeodomain-like domain-containing protein [Actinorugispora endophytica]